MVKLKAFQRYVFVAMVRQLFFILFSYSLSCFLQKEDRNIKLSHMHVWYYVGACHVICVLNAYD